MAEKIPFDLANEKAPINPFVETDKNKTEKLSSLQRKIVRFIEEEAATATGKEYGVQPPPVKVFGEEAIKLQKEAERKQAEFFEKYQITRDEHDLLVDLIFHGEIKLTFNVLGHSFLIRDLQAEIKRYITEVGRRISSNKAVSALKIKAVASALAEVDSIPLDKLFLEKYLWKMQANLLDLLFKMHLLTETYKMYLYEKLPNFVRTPTSRVRYAICQDMKIPINDPIFRSMSEEQVYWHYINAIKNQEIEAKVLDNRIDYITWFMNPEMAKKLQEKKEMHEESDANLVQKYSFINGISEMVGKDVGNDELMQTMELLMTKMKGNEKKERDPWDIPEKTGIDENDPFFKGMMKKSEEKKEEAVVGMVGGSPEWYGK